MSQKGFPLEPDVIAAHENPMPDLSDDLVLAKNFLKQHSTASGDSLYDHLVDLIHKIVMHKPPEIVDTFEHFSWELRKEKFRPNFDLLNDLYLAPAQLGKMKIMDKMCNLLAEKADKLNQGGEEEELDLEEDDTHPLVTDLIEHNFNFRQGGFGLPDYECQAIYLSLRMLAIQEPVSSVRFFGKIYGTRSNYYIAETNLTLDEWEKRIKLFDMQGMPGEGAEEEEAQKEEQEPEEEAGEGEQVTQPPKEPVPPVMPPEPVSTWQPPKKVPVERPGQGVNKMVYYVCNYPGEPWVCLPDVTPDQIRVARSIVKCMTGRLDSEVQVFPPFEGTEKELLRAQIARIAAATYISPQGYYTFGSGEEEEDVDLEEGGAQTNYNLNPFYQGHTLKDLLDHGLTYWVHHGQYILNQGRTLWWNPASESEEAVEEEEDEFPAIEPERGPNLMSSLAEDAKIEGIPIWTPRASSVLVPDRALVLMRSVLWPGAAAYSTTGKITECIYIGWGLKFIPPNYSPPQLPVVQQEYVIGPEVMEMADPTFADEEAYRIARLPPPPPPIVTEGEWPEEGEEED